MNYELIGKNLRGWATGLNWWKLAMYTAVLAGLFGAGYLMGGTNAKIECQKAKTEQAEKRIRFIKDFTNVQSEIAVLRERESIKLVEVITAAGVVLDEEIANKPDIADCSLTDGEFVQFNKIAETTR